MVYSVNEAWVNQYSDSLQLLSQQQNSVLENTVMGGEATGEYKFFDRIGEFAYAKKTASNAATSFTDVTHNKRAVSFDDYVVDLYIDKRDIKRALVDIEAGYVQGGVAGWNREKDSIIYSSFFADANEGKATGAAFTTQSFDTANQTVDLTYVAGNPIGAGNGTGSASGLTLDKILRARATLLKGKAIAPGDDIFCAIDPEDEISLLGIDEFKNSDYNSDPEAAFKKGIDPDGYIGNWLGINWLRSNHVPVVDAATDYRRVAMYVKSGVGFVKGGAPEVMAMPNPERKMAITLHMEGSAGSVRLEEKKVVEIRTLV